MYSVGIRMGKSHGIFTIERQKRCLCELVDVRVRSFMELCCASSN